MDTPENETRDDESTAPYSPDAIARAQNLLEKMPDRIGRYRILERIGGGGMGEVYVAEQTEPIKRRVAVKLIKAGMDTKQVVARFEAERQALAMMDHPNIAKVFDAGTTETGRPYFVMELVRGIPITKFCDDNKLTTRKRVELLVPICQAVQHAHQKGIIHRDIKPHNVLVTLHDGVPVPKVIDFGIAKATSQPLTDKTVYTEFRAMIGTPAYMSPEQAEMSGLDIDTRSDIYSLGVLAYELLTGSPPFENDRLVKAGLGEIQRIIREEDPPRPSIRLSTIGDRLTTIAKSRDVEPSKLSRLLAGELDWIVMRAMEKDRKRRYDTATDLAADFSRHLNGEPVVAAPPTWGYRTAKFIRRNKGTAITAAAVGTSLTVGLAIASWEAHRANQERATAERAETRVEADVAVATKTLGEMYASDTVKDKRSFGQGFVDMAGSATDMDGNPQARRSEIETLAYFASRDNKELREKTEAAEKANRAIEADRDLAMQTLGEMDAQADPKLRAIADTFNATEDQKHQIIGLGATVAANTDDDMQVVGKLSSLQVLLSRAKDNNSQLIQQRDTAELEAYTADLALAQSAMASGNWPEARARLDACPQSKRGWEWTFLRKQAGETKYSPHDEIYGMNSRGDALLGLTSNKRLRLLDTASGKQLSPFLHGTPESPSGSKLSGDGKVLGISRLSTDTAGPKESGSGIGIWNTQTGDFAGTISVPAFADFELSDNGNCLSTLTELPSEKRFVSNNATKWSLQTWAVPGGKRLGAKYNCRV